MVLLIPLAIGLIWAAWKIAESSQPFPAPSAAPAPATPPQGPVRHRTAGLALRVHLCTVCLSAPVATPGGQCYPFCEHPVHAAERILRETKGGVA